MINKSAWVPVKTDMSIGTRTVYGLFKRTPKLRSPLNNNRMNTPIWTSPTRAEMNNHEPFPRSLLNAKRTYIGHCENRSSDTESEREYPELRWSLVRSTRISKMGNVVEFRARLTRTESTYFVILAAFPKQDQQFLVEIDLLARTRQIRLCQRIIQQASEPFQHKLEILKKTSVSTARPITPYQVTFLPLLCGSATSN